MDRKWRALIVVCVAIFMLLLDITVVNVALPEIQKELHTSFTDLQWVVDAYALMLASVMLNAGPAADGEIVLFVGAVLVLALVRRSDFVASGPQQRLQPAAGGA